MEQLRGIPGSTPFSTECTKHITGGVSAVGYAASSSCRNHCWLSIAQVSIPCATCCGAGLAWGLCLTANPSTVAYPCTLQGSDSTRPETEALFSEKVLPGNAQELRDFSQEATRKSTCRVTCRLPYLLLAFPRKDVFDIIYHR